MDDPQLQTNTSFLSYIPGEVDLADILKYPMAMREFQAKLDATSEVLHKILFSDVTFSFLIKTAVEYDLTDDQAKEVSRIVRDILLGDLYLGDMIAQVKEKLGIDEEKARAISNALGEELFTPVLDEIKKLQLKNFSDRIGPVQQGNMINLKKKTFT